MPSIFTLSTVIPALAVTVPLKLALPAFAISKESAVTSEEPSTPLIVIILSAVICFMETALAPSVNILKASPPAEVSL